MHGERMAAVRGIYRAFASSAWVTAELLAQKKLSLPERFVGDRLLFADDTTSRIFRETVRHGLPERQPALLVVRFRLRFVRCSRAMHAMFRVASIANTLLFAGFPGFVSKLWTTDLQTGIYRGIYEWDGAEQATTYAITLAKLLKHVCVPGSVQFHVEPSIKRDEFLHDPSIIDAVRTAAVDGPGTGHAWWRLAAPVTT